jgi:rfaE bifunctional protein kinase chain/domain
VSGPDTSKASVLVVGDVMLDRYWFGDASRISPEAPVPVVHFREEKLALGGAANVAHNCVALGARTQLLSVVGADEAGDTLQRLLEERGIRAGLQRDPSMRTTVKLRVVGQRRHQLLRIDFETQPSHEVLASKLAEFEAALPACDVVILSDYGKGGLTHIVRMVEAARAAGKTVLVDPKGDDYTRYRGADLVTPNVEELRAVVGRWKDEDEADLERRAQALRVKLSLGALLLTRGEHGMSLYRAGGVQDFKAAAREVYDVSGAGDTVIASIGVMLGVGAPLDEAVRVANLAGGIKVGKFGTAPVTREELFG